MSTPDLFRAASDRVAGQLRAAARDLLDGDRASSDARRTEAGRIFHREAKRVADATLAAAWGQALADEKATREGKGA